MTFFLRKLLLFASPFLILLILFFGSYLYWDPFRVVYGYDDFSNLNVLPSRDYISTETFIRNRKKYNYDSFIFGTSRTLAFRPEEWKKYLYEKASPFMFDASNENLYGIYIKLKYLDSINVNVKNVLLIFCRNASFREKDMDGHLYVRHPETSNISWIEFHKSFLKAYGNLDFLYSFYSFKLTDKYQDWMKSYIQPSKVSVDFVTNRVTLVDREKAIINNPDKYYSDNNIFYDRGKEQVDSIQRINGKQIFYLTEIKRILEKHKSNYKIVLSPLYEQIKFSKADIKVLNEIFPNKVHDFSGVNSFTNSITNYYESSHFRINVGDSIMARIYTQ